MTEGFLEGKAVSESTVILALRSWQGHGGEGRQKCCHFLGPTGQLLLIRHLVASLCAQLGQCNQRPKQQHIVVLCTVRKFQGLTLELWAGPSQNT